MYQIKPTNKKNKFFKIALLFSVVFGFVLIINIFNIGSSIASVALSPFFKAGDYFYKFVAIIPKSFYDKTKLLAENNILSENLEQRSGKFIKLYS